MTSKQHAFLALSLLVLGCQHEVAMGTTDTQAPKAEAAPAANSPVPAAPAPSSPVPAAPIAAAGCSSDADCHPVDSYCGSCQCLALPVSAEAPKCEGTQVQCFVAPCRGQRALCKAGSCTLAVGSEM